MTHAELVNNWPSLREFASDLGVPYGTAKAMRRRNSIPVGHWEKVVSSAQRRGIDGVTIESLARSATKGEAA